MNPTIDLLRGELERLFSLEEMTSMSERLLGLSPEEVGGSNAKGSFARALTERCFDGDRLEALVDVVLHSRKDVDPRVRDCATFLAVDERGPGQSFGDFTILKKTGECDLGVFYRAERVIEDAKATYTLFVLRREAVGDRRAVHRFLTANRLFAATTTAHTSLPQHVEAGELEPGIFYVAYVAEEHDAPSLAIRLARMAKAPLPLRDLFSLLKAILEPLAAIHEAHLVHGDVSTETIFVGGELDAPRVFLTGFGNDRLRVHGLPRRTAPARASSGASSQKALRLPSTPAPELVRGRAADARSDVYAFGAVLFELLTSEPVFAHENATDAAFQHLASEPAPPSVRAPQRALSNDIDAFVLSLLDKDPERRPANARAVLVALESLVRAIPIDGRAARPRTGSISSEELQARIDALHAAPDDSEAALELEHAIAEGASKLRVAEAFADAASRLEGAAAEARTSLFYRAARLFSSGGPPHDNARAEAMYAALVALDPTDDVARRALEDVRRAQGKYDELVEMFLEQSQAAPPGEERGHALAEIGRLYAHTREVADPEQALVAYTQALCEVPANDEYASEVERLCGHKPAAWQETLETLTEAIKTNSTWSQADRAALLVRAARWYEARLGRADMALAAYQQVLSFEPASERAAEGVLAIYRHAQQWPELVTGLIACAETASTPAKARDKRAEAAEVLESRLNDLPRARDLLTRILADDPGHARAGAAMARIAERLGDFHALAEVLERRAETFSTGGARKAEALVKVAEVYEHHLSDFAEAIRRYEAVLAVDPANLDALKGLDRIFSRQERYREVLEVLERQIECAATPRQKITIFERKAAIFDEEFLDHARAATALEALLAIDAGHDAALTALARHYRALGKWENLVAVYDSHAAVARDEGRKVDLFFAKARALAEHIGSPERAIKAYEHVLKVQPAHAGALEALSHLREASGDAHAALTAIEALAANETTPEAKAEQWLRAGRLLDARGDKDGAIERFKRALEANPQGSSALGELRKAYAERNDWLSAISLLERQLGHASGALAKAQLHADLAMIFHAHLVDPEKAESASKSALALDPSNALALMVLGDLAFEANRLTEATKYYESLVSRTAVLPKDDAVRVLVRFIQAFGKTQPKPSQPLLSSRDETSSDPQGDGTTKDRVPPSRAAVPSERHGRSSTVPPMPASLPPPPVTNPRMLAAVDALQTLAPHDVDALARAANALFEFGDPQSAYRMHSDLFDKHGSELVGSDRAEALYHLGESARRSGDFAAAIAPLREAALIDPSNPRPFRSLAKIYDENEDIAAAVAVRRQRLEIAIGRERFDLLLEIGDVLFLKQNDRMGASIAYTQALEERPDDRRLLTKLMQLYSEERDWTNLVDVVLRLADFVEDTKQRAKYMHTAATIASKHLENIEQALGFYATAIDLDPENTRAIEEAVALHKQEAHHDSVERLLKLQLEKAKRDADRDKLVLVLDELGALYQTALGDPELAIDAFEAAQAFDPENRERAETLGSLYALAPAQYLDKAVKSQTAMLRRDPYRVESYKLLRKLFTDAKKADSAWCLCQALSVLRLAEPDEERFYKKFRSENAAPAQSVLDKNAWQNLEHWDLDPRLTRLFAMIQPTILRVRTQSLETLGYDPRYAIDCALHPYAVSQTLHYVGGVLGMPLPQVFQNPNDAGGFGIIHALTPAIALGRSLLEGQAASQSLVFTAARHVTYFRPGLYVRQLVPTGTGLKAWLFAAIKLCVPQFPISADHEGLVAEAMAALAQDIHGPARDKLASAVAKLLQGGGALDLKTWVAAVDLTADRVGLLLAHDLRVATEVVRATEEGASVTIKERMQDIVLFSVSEEYFALREQLAIAIEG